jgi:hypothetical protein
LIQNVASSPFLLNLLYLNDPSFSSSKTLLSYSFYRVGLTQDKTHLEATNPRRSDSEHARLQRQLAQAQMEYSIKNNLVLYSENLSKIKSNIEADRMALWSTLLEDQSLSNLAEKTLREYLDERPANNKEIKFTFPPKDENSKRLEKVLTEETFNSFKKDTDIQTSVLLSKVKTDPDLSIREGLTLKGIADIVNHISAISAWRADNKGSKSSSADEPEVYQALDYAIGLTKASPGVLLANGFIKAGTGTLSDDILVKKQDHNGRQYMGRMPLEEIFKKPSVINPDNLIRIAEEFKKLTGLNLVKDKMLDAYSVPVDPEKPQWVSFTDIRVHKDLDGSIQLISGLGARLSDTKRPKNTVNNNPDPNHSVQGVRETPVNNYTSTVVNENIADAQKALSDLFNPDLYFQQETSLAKTCQSFETQYPSIAQNPLILINNDKYCNSGVIQYLCFNERFDEASEAFKRAMPKLTDEEDKKFLESSVLTQAIKYDDINIKLCTIPQIVSLLKDTPQHELLTLTEDMSLYLKSLRDLIAKKTELNKDLIEYLDKEPRKNSKDCLLVCDLVRLFYEDQPVSKPFDKNLTTLIQKIQGEFIYNKLQESLPLYQEVLRTKPNLATINSPKLDIHSTNLGKSIKSLRDIGISDLYSAKTLSARIGEGIKTGEIFTQEEIHQSVKEYYEQGDNYI